MTDARRLSARLLALRDDEQANIDPDCGDPDCETCPYYRERAALLSDAARLAELVEAWKEARRAMGQHNMAPQRERVREAEAALLAFDLIGRGGVDG